jgi:aminoglycoside/choline kinase family phosphotransferase
MKALDLLVMLHGTVTDNVAGCPLLAGRIFDYEHLRWETAYFIERFVVGLRGMDIPHAAVLDDEFNRLALKADAFPKTVVHRDFQSQNIMVVQPDTPRLIDYQGARMAPPAYDVVSLLWDPYYRLDDSARTSLLEYYSDSMHAVRGAHFDIEQFIETLLTCRLQRHMQALGAYGFLSSIKGKKYFLKHVPEALRMLKEETDMARDEYPALHALVRAL